MDKRKRIRRDKRRRERRECYRLVYPSGEGPRVAGADYRVVDLSLIEGC